MLFAPVSSTNKTDGHDITQVLLKVALNTITLTRYSNKEVFIQSFLSLCYMTGLAVMMDV
jgi:hypothetical protein